VSDTTVTTITSPATGAEWEMVIGLEVHCELATATKLFCSCPNHFGDEPNTNICPVCLGLPGSLPVINEQAVELAMRIGRALHCDVHPSVFARKNYFYPDMPKDYQVSQYDQPINADGFLDLPDGSQVGIERAHMEEDTGKNTHAGQTGRIHGSEYSLIDYNRAGVPLVEIVSRPDLRGPEQAKTYVGELRQILLATGASDAKMEEGSMRVDANVSVRPAGEQALGTRCEIKNLNSLRSLGRAIEYEAFRQVDLLEAGDRVKQETRHWDEEAGVTRSGRSKEEAEDYRYFQEPDLVPLAPGADWLGRVEAELPVLPAERRTRLADVAGLEPYHPGVVVAVDRQLDDLAAGAIGHGGDAGRVLTHVEHNLAVEGADRLDPAALAELVGLELEGQLTATQAKTVLADMVATGGRPAEIAAAHGFEAMDVGALETTIDEIIAANPDTWAEFVGLPDGDKKLKKLKGFFTGEAMKATRGQADGKVVNALLDQKRATAG
jgi:aspartyl-tRNA(Asn)/glutamyl-tRNA(Gln) amidotransferase subunit B